MTEIPLHWQTISELSRRIHNGSLSPVALMEHLLQRVEALDGRLHSFRLTVPYYGLERDPHARPLLPATRTATPVPCASILGVRRRWSPSGR
jgi:Asp-tRNA(Asn)/Glu-tRNA(Gln) amidotransferase A subunit family amidase